MGAVSVLPGGVRGEDGLHRLGPAVSHSGQGPVYSHGYGMGGESIHLPILMRRSLLCPLNHHVFSSQVAHT